MATLDRIMEMQKQGISETEISTQLQNEGISPSEINNSFNQAKIKNAVSPPESAPPVSGGMEGMQASMAPNRQEQAASQIGSPNQPMSQEIRTQSGTPPPEIYPPQGQGQSQAYAPQEDYYQQTPQAYPQQDYYAPQGMMDTDTISEVAEQVVTEKLNDYKKKVGDISSFKITIQDKVANIDDRLKRIEDSIDKLQQAIIGKIGEFGETNAMIHKDLDNLHGTVSKLMNPLIDNYNELKRISK